MAVRAVQVEIGKRQQGDRPGWPVTISTDAELVRRDDDGEPFVEILEHSAEAIDWSRGDLPVLEGHNLEETNIGIVTDLRLDGNRVRGWLVLGASARAQELARDIDAGIVRGLSVGYKRLNRAWSQRPDGMRVMRVTRWQPYEASITGVPLDIEAGINRGGARPRRGRDMAEQLDLEQRAEGATAPVPATTTASVVTTSTREISCEDLDPEADAALYAELGCGEAAEGGERAAAGGQTPAASEAAPAGRSVAAEKPCKCAEAATRTVVADKYEDGVRAERGRQAEIRKLAHATGAGMDAAERAISKGLSLAGAARYFTKLMGDESPEGGTAVRSHTGLAPSGSVEAGVDRRDHFRRGVANALSNRIGLADLDDNGRQYRARRVADICRTSLIEAGGRRSIVDQFTDEQVVMAAMGLRDLVGRAGMHSTSDLPNIFGDLANASLRKGYMEAPQTFDPLVTRVTLPNLTHERKLLQLSEGPELVEVVEGAPYTEGTLSESKVTWKLTKYGRMFLITWEALLADQLDAISRLPAQFGAAARRKESAFVWGLITSNPVMPYDSVALFDAAHGNYDASGAALANDKLGAARAKIRRQKGLDGTTLLDLMPQYLIVPAALEHTAMTLLGPVAAAQASNVNLYAGKFTLIVEPRLDDADTDAWYLACSPSQIDMIEFGTLEGYGGPTITSEEAFTSDGSRLKARHVFGGAVVDHRGFYKSAGA
jgi:phage head maturation protease